MNEDPLLIIKNFYQIFGRSSLIFRIKADLFYNRIYSINNEMLLSVFNIISKPNITFIPPKELRHLLFIVCYFLYNTLKEAKELFNNLFLKNVTTEDKKELYFIFNLVEFELSYGERDSNYNLQLIKELSVFSSMKKNAEDYFLFYYYYNALLYLIRSPKCLPKTLETLTLLKQKVTPEKKNKRNILKFIELRTILMRVVSLDESKDQKEIKEYIDFLLNQIKPPLFSLVINLKLKSYQMNCGEVEYENIIQEFTTIYAIIKQALNCKQFGADIFPKMLYIYYLLGYYSQLQGNYQQTLININRLDRLLGYIEKHHKYFPNDIINKIAYFDFFKNVLQTLCNNRFILKKTDLVHSIKMLESSMLVLKDSTFCRNLKDLTQKNKVLDLRSNIRSNEVEYSIEEENKTQLCIYFLYSVIDKKFSQMQNLSENDNIKQHAKQLIEHCHNIFGSNIYAQKLVQNPFIKEIIIRIHYIYIYSFFFEKDYPAVEAECEFFFNRCKTFYKFKTYSGIFYKIKKLLADSKFKLQQYDKALLIYEEIYNTYTGIKEILFNIALCHFYLKDLTKAKEELIKCLELFKQDVKKLNVINTIIALCNEN